MLVYRVEHKSEGEGPFSENIDIFSGIALPKSTHPTPEEEGIPIPHGEWYCACESLNQLSDWFLKTWRKLHERNFHIVEFEVEEANCRVGKRQCIFDKSQAKIVNTFHMNTLLNEAIMCYNKA